MLCSFNSCDSKKLSSVLQFSDRSSIFAFTSVTNNNSFSKLSKVRVSRLDTEVSDVLQSCDVDRPVDLSDENVVSQSPKLYGEFRKGKRSIWKRLDGMKNVAKNSKVMQGSNSTDENESQREIVLDHEENDDAFYEKLSSSGGVGSSLGHCNFMLEKLERSGRDDEALKFFKWMRMNGKLMQNVNAYKLALRVLGRRQDWEGAERLIQEMQTDSCCELGFQVFNTLIFACKRRGLIGIGTKWFRMMLDKGVQPNVASFGMVMSLYQKGGAVDEAEFAFSQMRNSTIVCHSAYSAMITMYTRLGLYEKAEEVIGFLRKDGVILNLENWLVLLNAYSQNGKLDEAEKALASMHAAGFSPHIVAYNTLITGYGKVSNMEAAERILQTLVSAGLKPDETTYRTMIEGWGRVDNFKEAERYYKEMNRLGFKPNSSNLYTMINLQAKNGDEAGAVRTINDMITMGCQFSSILGIVLQAYEKVERFDKVPSVVKGMLYNHVLNNQTSCSILVMGYVKHGLVDDTIEVLHTMENRKRPIFLAMANSCKKHPKHQQSPGVCSLCLRERLSKISSSSSRAVTNASSSSSSSSVSSVSSASSSRCSSNAQSHVASPMHGYRNPRKTNYDLDGVSKGYLSLMKKSRSMAFVSEKTVESDGRKKKRDGFWSKLMKVSKRRSNTQRRSKELEGSSRLIHSRTMREMLNKWV